METGTDKLRFNPRKSQYKNLDHVSTTGDYEVSFTSSGRNRAS